MATRKAPPRQALTVNVNTILGGIGTILCGLILWMVTGALSANKQTNQTVSTISTQFPYLQKAVDATDAGVKEANKDLKEAKAQMVTRQELDNKHARLQEAIKDVKDDVKDVRVEQKRLADDITKQRKDE